MQWPLIGRQSDLDHSVGLVESGTGLAIVVGVGQGHGVAARAAVLILETWFGLQHNPPATDRSRFF